MGNQINALVVDRKEDFVALPRYKECTGLDDIRLLVVANRIMNSGKLSLQERPALNVRGFQVVYFLSYPESVTVFECADNTA